MKSSAEIAEIARQAGHTVSFHEKEFPEYEVPGKYWWTCTCGGSSNKLRVKRFAVLGAILHLAERAAEVDEEVARSGYAKRARAQFKSA